MVLIRSQAIAGQASTLAQASAERARRLAEEANERLRAEGRAAADQAAQIRINAAEQRARDAEARAENAIAKAKADAEARLGTAAAALERALASISVLERQVIEAAEGETVRLALAIANRILAREIAADPAWMRDLLATALADVPDRRRVVVRCAPSDAAMIRERLAGAAAAVPGTERLELEADDTLAAGSLILVAGGTRLDASIAGSWERVAARMLAAAPRPALASRDDGSVPEVAP
jgi:flagellar assembly protein FliH